MFGFFVALSVAVSILLLRNDSSLLVKLSSQIEPSASSATDVGYNYSGLTGKSQVAKKNENIESGIVGGSPSSSKEVPNSDSGNNGKDEEWATTTTADSPNSTRISTGATTFFVPNSLGLRPGDLVHFTKQAKWTRAAPDDDPRQKPKPAYDHLSCRVMKNRYNCAVPAGSNSSTPDDSPTDYMLTLGPVVVDDDNNNINSSSTSAATSKNDVVVSLNSFMDEINGVTGLAEVLATRRRRHKTTNLEDDDDDDGSIVTVAFFGNSFLRQIWESITCTFRDQITKLRLNEGGAMVPGHRSKFDAEKDIGAPLFFRSMPEQYCFPGDDMTQFASYYKKGVEIPQNVKFHCTDNLAMVELDEKIRFYYFFRPSVYEPRERGYESLGLVLEDIDVAVFNDKEHKMAGPDRMKQLHGARKIAWWGDKQTHYEPHCIRDTQIRDLGKYYSPDPLTPDDPDDPHGCMPGPVDDQMHLLFYLLYYDLGIQW